MTYVATAVVSALVVFVVFAAVMAPRHWEWYQENKRLTEQLRIRTEERDHYKQLVAPFKWGPQPDEVKIKTPIYGDTNFDPGPIEHRFDDIMDGE